MTQAPLECLPVKTQGCQENFVPAHRCRRGLSPRLCGRAEAWLPEVLINQPKWVSCGPAPFPHSVTFPSLTLLGPHSSPPLPIPSFSLKAHGHPSVAELSSDWTLFPTAIVHYWVTSVLTLVSSFIYLWQLYTFLKIPISRLHVISMNLESLWLGPGLQNLPKLPVGL